MKPPRPASKAVSFWFLTGVLFVLLVSLACGAPVEFSPDFDFQAPPDTGRQEEQTGEGEPQNQSENGSRQSIPTFTVAPNASPQGTPPPNSEAVEDASIFPEVASDRLVELHNQLIPGVVNIAVAVERAGQMGTGAGSGFIIDEQGHIITNNHVIEGATTVIVEYYNGFQSEARVIGADEYSDLAVLQVDELAEGSHPLPLGDSDGARPGQWVLAFGNPFGNTNSMTLGIISAIGRSIPSGLQSGGLSRYLLPEAIQTDAAINPGNSGGPLINLSGEVIGVNAQIATGGVAANSGVGFAIPSNVVRQVVPVLMSEGAYSWPHLGVEGGDVNLLVQRELGLEEQGGAYIAGVTPGGPADDAGIEPGDVIIEADGEPVENFDELLARVAFSSPGTTIHLTILRNGEARQVDAVLEPRPLGDIP
jgi:S1-C subfamily serine protease